MLPPLLYLEMPAISMRNATLGVLGHGDDKFLTDENRVWIVEVVGCLDVVDGYAILDCDTEQTFTRLHHMDGATGGCGVALIDAGNHQLLTHAQDVLAGQIIGCQHIFHRYTINRGDFDQTLTRLHFM